MLGIGEIKVIVLATLFAVTVICIYLPFRAVTAIRHTLDPALRRRYKRALSLLNCFGGGVFMAACLLDLFPESRESLERILKQYDVQTDFPVAEFVMVFGFFLVFVVEQLVMYYKETVSARRNIFHGLGHEDGDRQRSRSEPVIRGISDQPQLVPASEQFGDSVEDSHDHSLTSTFTDDGMPHSKLRTIVLLVSLSLHSVFEGIAIGLQPSIDSVVQLFIVVIIHKSVIAFSLGLSIVQSRLALPMTIACCAMFTLASPLGMSIGIGIEGLKDSASSAVASGILQGLACGTFLYVTFFEILPHEMNNRHNRIFKVLFILFGFATICAVIFCDPID